MTGRRTARHMDPDPGWVDRRFRELEGRVADLDRNKLDTVPGATVTVNQLLTDPTNVVEYIDTDTTTATVDDADVVLTLSYVPIAGSLWVRQNGVVLEASEFTRAGKTVVIPSSGSTILAGDVFSAWYVRATTQVDTSAPLSLELRGVNFDPTGAAGIVALPPETELGDLIVVACMYESSLTCTDARLTKVSPGGAFGALYVGTASDLTTPTFSGSVAKMVIASFVGGASVLNAATLNSSPYPASVPNLASVAGSVAIGAVWQQTSVVPGLAPSIASPFEVAVLSDGTTNYHSMVSIYFWQDPTATNTPAAACAFSGAVDAAQATVVSLEAL